MSLAEPETDTQIEEFAQEALELALRLNQRLRPATVVTPTTPAPRDDRRRSATVH